MKDVVEGFVRALYLETENSWEKTEIGTENPTTLPSFHIATILCHFPQCW